MTHLAVGLSAWIVQDGNYGEFEVGGSYRFAVEFYPHQLTECALAPTDSPSLRLRQGSDYEVRGHIVMATASYWVIDCGVLMYQEAPPPHWARVGAGVQGELYVGVDPFFYFESLRHEPAMPDLFRNWVIRRILLETTPWQDTVDASGRPLRTRVQSEPTFVEVPRTDSWNDDGGHAHYILDCELRPAG